MSGCKGCFASQVPPMDPFEQARLLSAAQRKQKTHRARRPLAPVDQNRANHPHKVSKPPHGTRQPPRPVLARRFADLLPPLMAHTNDVSASPQVRLQSKQLTLFVDTVQLMTPHTHPRKPATASSTQTTTAERSQHRQLSIASVRPVGRHLCRATTDHGKTLVLDCPAAKIAAPTVVTVARKPILQNPTVYHVW